MKLYVFRVEKDIDALIKKMKKEVPFFSGFNPIGKPQKMMGNFSALLLKDYKGDNIKITGLNFDMNRLYEKLL